MFKVRLCIVCNDPGLHTDVLLCVKDWKPFAAEAECAVNGSREAGNKDLPPPTTVNYIAHGARQEHAEQTRDTIGSAYDMISRLNDVCLCATDFARVRVFSAQNAGCVCKCECMCTHKYEDVYF